MSDKASKTPWSIQKVSRRGSLSMHVVDQLLALINDGRIAVGDKLPTENRLCDSFGVSRTVIREAITHLKSLGLVETRRGVGTTVLRSSAGKVLPAERINPTTVDDILHVLEVRLNLEPAAAALAAERHDEEGRRRIEAKHAAFARACDDNSQARSEDYEFHYAIAMATKNPVFTVFYDQLSESIIPRGRLLRAEINDLAAPGYLQGVLEEHQDIVDAIMRRDPECSREAMLRHLQRSRGMYAQYPHHFTTP